MAIKAILAQKLLQLRVQFTDSYSIAEAVSSISNLLNRNNSTSIDQIVTDWMKDNCKYLQPVRADQGHIAYKDSSIEVVYYKAEGCPRYEILKKQSCTVNINDL